MQKYMTAAQRDSAVHAAKKVNPFGCPPSVYRAMQDPLAGTLAPLLVAVKKLGPKRVQWGGQGKVGLFYTISVSNTCWLLDGRRATHGELLKAAKVQDVYERSSPASDPFKKLLRPRHPAAVCPRSTPGAAGNSPS